MQLSYFTLLLGSLYDKDLIYNTFQYVTILMKKGYLKSINRVAASNRGALGLNGEPGDVTWNCNITTDR